MKCTDIKKLLSGYLDGDIGEIENSLVSEHLKICNSCSKELDLLRNTVSLLKTRKPVEPPPDFVVQVRKKIEARRWWRDAIKIIFYPLHIKIPAEAIATVVIVCLLYLIYHEPTSLKPQKIGEKAIPVIETEKSVAPQRDVANYYREPEKFYPKTKEGINKAYRLMEQSAPSLAQKEYKATEEYWSTDRLNLETEKAEEIMPEQTELSLTLKNPKKDLLKIKKYISLLDAKDILEIAEEKTISFRMGRKNYLILIEKFIQMGIIKPQEIKKLVAEDMEVKLRIR